ncbi:PREDICTED: uncharacterized protein LOC105366144 [Ceratosolen solmsi marchali]|uniref:Uncharacterized protein LOC105366144 n=1 Tax=Ceratosolen solmsi marchali TaxID=326594 RepID=A0AAJ6YR91_9HYME|nr:PREDICTED: uncharacterized protein LOC105366144 [Ceratosolen solmsi marchali]
MLNDSNQNESWNLSPIMDYDEWTPLGLGDPLKNDPTFDYLPPVLDHVQYWLDSYNIETSTKHDILALGIAANKTDLKRSHQIIKFIDESNFTRKEENSLKHDLTDSIGAEFPKMIGATNFHTNIISQNQNKIQPFNYVLNQYYNYKSRPFRILLPPYNSLKPKNNSIRNNIYSSLNGKFNFFELPLQISTQTGKGPKVDKMQQYNITEKVYSKDHSDAKLQSKLFSKLKWPIILSEIEDRENYTQDFKQKYKTTTITFQKSNLIYQSTQKSLRSLLNTSTSPTLLSLKKIIKSYNENNDQEFFEINTPIYDSSSDAVTENSNISVQRNKNNNDHIKIFLLPPIKYESSISSPININMYDRKIKTQSVLPQVIQNNHIKKGYTSAVMTTILPPTKITITSRVTTDSIFSHYKQPDKPFEGPMYIIIEGHSKVKTYKPIVNERDIPMSNNKQINNISQ